MKTTKKLMLGVAFVAISNSVVADIVCVSNGKTVFTLLEPYVPPKLSTFERWKVDIGYSTEPPKATSWKMRGVTGEHSIYSTQENGQESRWTIGDWAERRSIIIDADGSGGIYNFKGAKDGESRTAESSFQCHYVEQ